jgi:3-oxoacyl-[acyl-carrier-protein] synthase-3
VTAACCGFLFGLSAAEQYLKAGTYKTALVAAVEIMSRTLDWTDRESCILWGDGSGAAVLRAYDELPKDPHRRCERGEPSPSRRGIKNNPDFL